MGWLCKTGLNNTTLQRRWCVVHDLKLFYFEGPRVSLQSIVSVGLLPYILYKKSVRLQSEEPNGFVNLR